MCPVLASALALRLALKQAVCFAQGKEGRSRTAELPCSLGGFGSRSIERAGPQIRQAAAAARHELLKLASAQLGAPVDKLTVIDGVVRSARSRNTPPATRLPEVVKG